MSTDDIFAAEKTRILLQLRHYGTKPKDAEPLYSKEVLRDSLYPLNYLQVLKRL